MGPPPLGAGLGFAGVGRVVGGGVVGVVRGGWGRLLGRGRFGAGALAETDKCNKYKGLFTSFISSVEINCFKSAIFEI